MGIFSLFNFSVKVVDTNDLHEKKSMERKVSAHVRPLTPEELPIHLHHLQ